MTIALHRARFRWGKVQLEIECTQGHGEWIAHPPSIPSLTFAEADKDANLNTAPQMCWRETAPVLFERFQLRENSEYYVDITLPIDAPQAKQRAAEEPGWPFSPRLATIFKLDPGRRWRENDDGTITVSGQLRLRNHAGVLNLSPFENSPLHVEVICAKIGYLDEFQRLLDAVAEEYTELLLQYDSPVSSNFNFSDAVNRNESAVLFHLRYVMAEHNLPVALDEMKRALHVRLDSRRVMRTVTDVSEPDVPALAEQFDGSNVVCPGPLASLFRGYSPREMPVLETQETADTAENRYVKNFLEELRLIAQNLVPVLAAAGRRASLREAQDWLARLDDELASNAWRDVGQLEDFPTNSQVLQKRRGYRDILKLDLTLRTGLELPWARAEELADGLIGDLRPVNELYEYWCLFVLRRTLAELALPLGGDETSLVEITKDGLQLNLLRGKASVQRFEYQREGQRPLRLRLFYNRAFHRREHASESWSGSYTARFHPDYSIEIVSDEAPSQTHWLHFDAKYRLELKDLLPLLGAAGPGDEIDEEVPVYEAEIRRVNRREDLFKMHTYRDGILGSRGAYILFPGTNAELRLDGKNRNLFIRHPTAVAGDGTHAFPSVGAFDLCPGWETEQQATLALFLRNVFDDLSSDAVYREEEGLFQAE
jgi:predicted component of viral defense system (DUF524 family)